METLKDVYLSREQFEKDLESCLTIINYPSKTRKYYVCEHISPALLKRKVRVFISPNKQKQESIISEIMDADEKDGLYN